MIDAAVRVSPQPGATVSNHLFGAFVEHFGRSLYGGLWDLERQVPRADVLAAASALGVTVLRYPGGCFSDTYHWRDGVGDRATRPHHERTFWTDFRAPGVDAALAERFGPPEPNAFGTDEFLDCCALLDVEPMLNANFGSGTPEEAAAWVEHCRQRPSGPRVSWWGVGNETFGPWEVGHCPPEEYATRFVEFARAMRAVDPEVRLMAVGCGDPAYGADGWNEKLTAAAGDEIDLVSLHFYFPGPMFGRELRDDETELVALVAGARSLGSWLDDALAEIDRGTTGAPLPVALDEWSYFGRWDDLLAARHRRCDALYFASCLNRLIERADRVKMALISHLVNCMAPIQTEGDRMHVTAAYLALQLYRRHLRRWAREVAVEAPSAEVVPLKTGELRILGGAESKGGRTSLVDATAVGDERGVTVYVGTASLEGARVDVSGLPPGASGRLRWLDSPSPFDRNDVDAPTRITVRSREVAVDPRGRCRIELPPAGLGALVVEA